MQPNTVEGIKMVACAFFLLGSLTSMVQVHTPPRTVFQAKWPSLWFALGSITLFALSAWSLQPSTKESDLCQIIWENGKVVAMDTTRTADALGYCVQR